MIHLRFPSERRSMNSCYGLWKQVRKTGPVHWEGRGDIEWCVCDICAHTHTHMLKELPLYLPLPPSREERFATFHPHPTCHYLLFGFIPMPDRASSVIYFQHPSFQKENTVWLYWGGFLMPASASMIKNDELLLERWGFKVTRSGGGQWTVFGAALEV